jgi:hypothetical protein
MMQIPEYKRFIGITVPLWAAPTGVRGFIIEISPLQNGMSAPWQGSVVAVLPVSCGYNEQNIAEALEKGLNTESDIERRRLYNENIHISESDNYAEF